MLEDPILERFVQAIATQEGFHVEHSRPQRYNNPGDLRSDGIVWKGQSGTDADGFCIFDTVDDGWRALRLDLQNHSRRYPRQSLTQFIAGDGDKWTGYAPAKDHNSPLAYANFIAEQLGCDRDTTFAQLSAQVNA